MTAKKAHAAGASKSLNRSIKDIMAFLDGQSVRSNSELRDFLNEKIGDLSEHWFRRGFNRGHRQSYKKSATEGEVPVKLSYQCERNLFHGNARELRLRSRIKRSER